MRRILSSLAGLALLTASLVGAGASARADISLKLDTHINGATPQGYLLANFATVSTGEVTLTLDATNLVAGEYVAGMGFNIDPIFAAGFPGSLTIARTGGTAPSTAITSTTLASNGFDIGSQVKGGFFDFGFNFASAEAKRFAFGDTVILKLTGTNLVAESFAFKSVADGSGNPGGWYAAGDVRGIPVSGANSGSIGTKNLGTVPEPASLAMIAMGIPGLIAFARRRKAASV